MIRAPFIPELCALLDRFSDLGIGADIDSLSLSELWGVYRHLKRLAES